MKKENLSLQNELNAARRALNSDRNSASAVRKKIQTILDAFEDYVLTDQLSYSASIYAELYDTVEIHPDHVSAADLLNQAIGHIDQVLKNKDME